MDAIAKERELEDINLVHDCIQSIKTDMILIDCDRLLHCWRMLKKYSDNTISPKTLGSLKKILRIYFECENGVITIRSFNSVNCNMSWESLNGVITILLDAYDKFLIENARI